MCYVNLSLHLRRLLGLAAYGWQEVLNNIVLPVANLTVTLDLLRLIIIIVYIEPSVVREVSKSHLIEALEEHMVGRRLI